MANMENEKKIEPAKTPAPKKAKKRNIFVRAGARIARWVREMRSELNKVAWPSRKVVVNKTIVALVVIAAVALVVGGFDWLTAMAYKGLLRFTAFLS